MSEVNTYNPYEGHETYGSPMQDLAHAAEMSLRHRHLEVTPENIAHESKRVAYDSLARLIARGVSELRVLAQLQNIDIFSLDSVRNILQEMVYFAVSDVDNIDLVVKAAIDYELREDADAIDLNGEHGEYLTNAFVSTLGEQGLEDANRIQAILGLGASTAGRVMSAYWRMIHDSLPDGADFYMVARADKSLKTLSLITRAWHLSDSDDGMRALGIDRGSQEDQTMTPQIFDVSIDGVSINPHYKDVFKTKYPDERVSCPAGKMVDLTNQHGEAERVMPIKEIACVLLDAWHSSQTSIGDSRESAQAV